MEYNFITALKVKECLFVSQDLIRTFTQKPQVCTDSIWAVCLFLSHKKTWTIPLKVSSLGGRLPQKRGKLECLDKEIGSSTTIN